MTAATEPSGELVEKRKLDLGCGTRKKEGFFGVDRIAFPGVDQVFDFAKKRWPFKSNSIGEAFCSHTIEHLTTPERIHFVNELYRVLEPGGKCTLITPHWCSSRAYGDPTHQWPPVSEMWLYYLKREWRATEAPHTDVKHWPQGFSCDFDATWGYGMNPNILSRNSEFQQFALNYYKEAAMDLHATLTKK